MNGNAFLEKMNLIHSSFIEEADTLPNENKTVVLRPSSKKNHWIKKLISHKQ